MSSARYPQEARLHRPSEYTKVFAYRRVHRGALFTLHYCPNGLSHARLGLVIAKRFAARAVTRSTIKRVIRESFRHFLPELSCHDFIVRLHCPIAPSSLRVLRKIIRNDIDALLGLF